MTTTQEDRSVTDNETKAGAWVVYDHDRGPYAISLHAQASDAAHAAARKGYGRVGWWPFDAEFSDAIKEWEGRR